MSEFVIVVTGGSGSTGKVITKTLIEANYRVVIVGRSKEKLEETKQQIDPSDKIMIYPMDVRDPEESYKLVKYVDKHFGRIDALINNAAGNFTCPSEKISINGWNSVIDIVLNGTWYCTQAVAKYWIEKGQEGQVINMLASFAWTGGAGVAHSASAKSGVLTLTRTLASEWGSKYGIRVNAITPGPIANTTGQDKLFESENLTKITEESVPLNRLAYPEEIANLTKFLLSPQTTYINGENITIDGGQWFHRELFMERLKETENKQN